MTPFAVFFALNELFEVAFDLLRVCVDSQSDPLGDPFDVGINNHSSFCHKLPPRTTLAVFLPTPAKARSSSISDGTSPPWISTRDFAMLMIFLVFILNMPVLFMMAETSSCEALESAKGGSGYFSNKSLVTILTLASVHWALRMVAVRS